MNIESIEFFTSCELAHLGTLTSQNHLGVQHTFKRAHMSYRYIFSFDQKYEKQIFVTAQLHDSYFPVFYSYWTFNWMTATSAVMCCFSSSSYSSILQRLSSTRRKYRTFKLTWKTVTVKSLFVYFVGRTIHEINTQQSLYSLFVHEMSIVVKPQNLAPTKLNDFTVGQKRSLHGENGIPCFVKAVYQCFW